MTIDLLTILYLTIIIVFCIVGFNKGFLKSVVQIAKGFVSFIISSILTIPLARFIINSGYGQRKIAENIDLLTSKGGIFVKPYNLETKEEFLDSMHIAKILQKPFLSMIDRVIPETGEEVTVAEAVSPMIIHYLVVGICFIIFFVVFRLLLMLLNNWIDEKLNDHEIIASVDKILGTTIYGIVGLAIVFLISYAISFVVPFDSTFSRWLVSQLHLDDNVFTLSKFIYNHNIIVPIFAWFSRA